MNSSETGAEPVVQTRTEEKSADWASGCYGGQEDEPKKRLVDGRIEKGDGECILTMRTTIRGTMIVGEGREVFFACVDACMICIREMGGAMFYYALKVSRKIDFRHNNRCSTKERKGQINNHTIDFWKGIRTYTYGVWESKPTRERRDNYYLHVTRSKLTLARSDLFIGGNEQNVCGYITFGFPVVPPEEA